MNRIQLIRGLAKKAVRRKLRHAGPVRRTSVYRGMFGLGSVTSDLQRRTSLLGSIGAFRNEMQGVVANMPKCTLKDNATAYSDVMDKMTQTLGAQQYEIDLRAGGNAANEVVRMMNSYDALLAARKEMWASDLADPSGQASMALADEARKQAQARTVQAGENIEFWEKVTDIDNPFSPLSIFATIKKYAIWGLVIGGVVLSAPVLFPAVGKLIGHARKPQSAPKPVTANRRRR